MAAEKGHIFVKNLYNNYTLFNEAMFKMTVLTIFWWALGDGRANDNKKVFII